MRDVNTFSFDSLRCVGFGYKPADLHRWGPGVRDLYAFHYIISGKGYYMVNKVCHQLQAGESFLIFPDTEVYYYPEEQDPWEYVWVEFRGDEVKELIDLTTLSVKCPVTQPLSPECPIEWRNLYHIPEAYRINRFEIERGSARLRLLLSYYIEYFPKNQSSVTFDYVKATKHFIKSNYWRTELMISDIIQHVNIDRTYLFRLFKQATDQSVHQYLTAYRIKKACDLLYHSDLEIKIVAYSVGYADPLYFSKIFKRITGATPTQYRIERILNQNCLSSSE